MAKKLGEALLADENLRKEFIGSLEKIGRKQMSELVAFAGEHGVETSEEELKTNLFKYLKSGEIREELLKRMKEN